MKVNISYNMLGIYFSNIPKKENMETYKEKKDVYI